MAKEVVVCDTDVIIDYWTSINQRHSDTKHILETEIEIKNISITAITRIELMLGARNKEDLKRITKKSDRYHTWLIDNEITISAMQLLQDYRLSHGLALPDAFIAATCKVLVLKLFTHNIKDYIFIDGLKLYKPQ